MTAANMRLYRDLAAQLKALLEGKADLTANTAALIYHRLPDLT